MNAMPAHAAASAEPATTARAESHPPSSLPPHTGVAAHGLGERPTRHERIAAAAYQRAEQRGFAPGAELDDWLQAEREVDAEDGRDD